MSNMVREATKELRWEQIQAAIAELLRDGNTPISLVEIARRCNIPRSSLSKETSWKAAIMAAEAVRVRREAEKMQQLRVDFLPTLELPSAATFPMVAADPPRGDRRRISIETVVHDLQALLAQSAQETMDAHERGRREAFAELESRREDPLSSSVSAAYERGREDGRSEFAEDLNQAYQRGVKDGRQESDGAYERGLVEGRKEAGVAYQRGMEEGRQQAVDPKEAYERGRQDGLKEGGQETANAFDRGRQVGRAEHQAELKLAYEKGVKEGKSEAAADVMNAYDRGRRDGWEEGRREGGVRSRFGFGGAKVDPDREWALAILHATASTTIDQLRATYRMLTKAYHPDRNPDLSPEFIRNLNRAKELLGI